MATPTYDLISEQVLGSAAASVTFSSIPGTYKDLIVHCFHKLTPVNASNIYLRYNGDTGNNYSDTWMNGDGAAANSGRETNFGYCYTGPTNSTNDSLTVANIFSYANTAVYKMSNSRNANVSVRAMTNTHIWRNAAAITSITVGASASTFVAGCTFRLYGIAG